MISSRHAKILLSGLVVAVLVAPAWFLREKRDEAPAPAYGRAKVVREDIRAVVSATGTLNPMNTVQVGSQVSGTIQALSADFNDEVKKGQIVAQIDPAIFRAKVAEAEANLQSAEAARDKAWVSVLNTKRELDRQVGLYKQKLVAESVLDEAQFAYDAAVVEHKLQLASVAKAVAVRERERVNLAYTSIYAPIDGVIVSRDVDVGQTVAASLQAPTLFTIANDLTQMQVEAEVDEAFIGAIQEQQPVQFTVFAYQERLFHGRVAQVRLQPTVEAGVVKYNCIIHVDNAELLLKPGMTATVAIEIAHRPDVLQVPNAALRFVPEWPRERLAELRAELKPDQAVLWAEESRELTPISVNTGIVGETMTEISGDNLEEGMKIAVPMKRKERKRRRKFGLSLF